MRVLFALLSLLFATSVAAQTPVKQSGNVTPTHPTCWTTNGTVQDCGTAAIPYASVFGTVGQGDTICAWSALSTSGAAQKICLGANTSTGADITVQNFGAASALPLTLNLNGVVYQFPFTLPGTGVIGPNSSVVNNVALWNNSTGTLLKDGGGPVRIQLLGNQNYYVNGNSGSTAACGPAGSLICSAGSDSNNCLAPGTSCLTLARAYDLIIGNIDMAFNYAINIYLAHNTGTTNYDLSCLSGPFIGNGAIKVIGDSGAVSATVVQDPNFGYGLQIKDLCTIEYDYIAFADSVGTNAAGHILVGSTGNAGHLDLNGVTLQAINNSGSKITVGALGSVALTGGITDTGNGGIFLNITAAAAQFNASGQTVTVSGTPAYNITYANIVDGGQVIATNTTFSGSATGPRCIVVGALAAGGFDPNAIFPGSSSCVPDTIIGAIGIVNGSTAGYGTAGQPLLSGGAAGTKMTFGTLGVAAGGTGATTLTGAVKGNGTSAFTQAACADLSNGGTACAQNTGTSGANVPLLNGNNTTSGNNTHSGAETFSSQIISTTGLPTIASGACGATTNGAVVSGSTNQSGQITIGSAATTTCTISWSATLTVAPNACVFFPMNATAAATGTTVARVGAPSTTQVVLTGSALANANYAYLCL